MRALARRSCRRACASQMRCSGWPRALSSLPLVASQGATREALHEIARARTRRFAFPHACIAIGAHALAGTPCPPHPFSPFPSHSSYSTKVALTRTRPRHAARAARTLLCEDAARLLELRSGERQPRILELACLLEFLGVLALRGGGGNGGRVSAPRREEWREGAPLQRPGFARRGSTRCAAGAAAAYHLFEQRHLLLVRGVDALLELSLQTGGGVGWGHGCGASEHVRVSAWRGMVWRRPARVAVGDEAACA